MRRTVLASVGILVLLALVIVVGVFLNSGTGPVGSSGSQSATSSPSPSPSPSSNTTNQNNGDDSAPPSQTSQSTDGGSVYIANMMFTPSQITIQVGATVTWNNNDTVAHTVTVDRNMGGAGPVSGTIPPGGSYSYTFATNGSFAYHCDIHTSMRGTVVVQ